MVTGKVYTLGIMVTVGKSFSLKPDGMELEIAELQKVCGFVKFCKHFSHKIAHLVLSKENRCILQF